MISEIIIGIILAYLLGSIPTSIWVGRALFHTDIRQHGSGNAGATNMIRVLGWKVGLPVFIFDVFKGWLAVKLADFILSPALEGQDMTIVRIALAAAAILGHVFPVFAGFRGGKGVASLLGVGIALYPVSVWVVLGVFLIVLFSFGYVSLGSILAAVAFPFIDLFVFHQQDPWLIGLAMLVAVFIPLTHRKNITRLLQGKESKFIRRKGKG